ncbi:MAG: geranylgeranylglycerol-phosphate geranylgeranyltransferase [Chitinophagales bacterium]|nr:geranylgeranylglycerol-phosphate geranylgeranyltransferase [Chitinophagales bacterium]MDW8428311.1 geranylgeranylglycerol-phosphate geranylgeranyltransferase [Chitinophagales bacterium]
MKVAGLFRLVRGGNLLLVALTQALVQFTIIEPILQQAGITPTLTPLLSISLIVATVLVAAGGYIINDYFDVSIDTINRPGKVVIDRSIPRRLALLLHQLLTWTGVAIATAVSWQAGNPKLMLVHVLAAAMLWLYSAAYKRKALAGNLVVALLTALVVALMPLYERQLFYPSTVEGRQAARTILIIVFYYFSFAFLVSLVREWVKDLQDMEGDRRFGSRTLPLLWGQKRVRWLSILLLGGIIFMIGAIQLMQIKGKDYASAFTLLVMLQLPLVATVYMLVHARQPSQFRLAGNLLKWVMFMGVLTMLYFYLVTLRS